MLTNAYRQNIILQVEKDIKSYTMFTDILTQVL